MNPPGSLDELGDGGREAWVRRVEARTADAIRQFDIDPPNRFVIAAPDDRTPHRTSVDWPGLPLRPVGCLTRERALQYMDLSGPGVGIRPWQEEYIEWRVVRADNDGIRRVELTTELADYWQVLAAYEPQRTLELVSSFARTNAAPEAVYRGCDPFSSSTAPEEREAAFVAAMLAPDDPSPYNDGRAAIVCMGQRTNTLGALIALVLVATNPRVIKDMESGRIRCLTCDESIPLMGNAAQLGRASDPVLVERLARLAYEGRLVSLDDPLGVYIQSAEVTRLRMPDGEQVPPEWFTFERGQAAEDAADDRPRWQRLIFEPPDGSGLLVSDLVDVATEEPIRHGGQVADLVQVAVILRVSDAEVEPPGTLEPAELAAVVADEAERCGDIQQLVERVGAGEAP